MVQLLLYLFVQALFSFFYRAPQQCFHDLDMWIEMYEPEEIVGAFNIAVWLNYISLAPLCVIIKILTVFLDEKSCSPSLVIWHHDLSGLLVSF